jgi:hypothetical protein
MEEEGECEASVGEGTRVADFMGGDCSWTGRLPPSHRPCDQCSRDDTEPMIQSCTFDDSIVRSSRSFIPILVHSRCITMHHIQYLDPVQEMLLAKHV